MMMSRIKGRRLNMFKMCVCGFCFFPDQNEVRELFINDDFKKSDRMAAGTFRMVFEV